MDEWMVLSDIREFIWTEGVIGSGKWKALDLWEKSLAFAHWHICSLGFQIFMSYILFYFLLLSFSSRIFPKESKIWSLFSGNWQKCSKLWHFWFLIFPELGWLICPALVILKIIIDSTLKLLKEADDGDQCPHNVCVGSGVEGMLKSILPIIQTRCPVLVD